MKLIIQTPKKALKPFLRQKPLRSEIDLFKCNLIGLLDKISIIEKQTYDETEEHLKNNIRDFLRDTWYKDSNAINTKDKKDLVIHLGKTTDSEAGVIIEAKRPGNVSEMVSVDHPNRKALHELILYYLNERNKTGNIELKQLVVTNIYEWYIIDANYFDKHIFRNTQIQKLYKTKQNDHKDNPFFYEEISKILQSLELEIPCIHFDIRDYEKILRNNRKDDDRELIALYKILSPQHLLKIATPNDSNSLDEKFYKELLHIIGLEEVKEGSKSIIRRKKENRNPASFIELTIDAINTEDTLHRLPDQSVYGETREERIFNIALELCITWINRILFLKLLESQLVTYHRGDKDWRFLNTEMIHDFDELFKLFHKVLAVNLKDRSEAIKAKYSKVPYLNSSLFEISELEDQIIKINSLENDEQLELIGSTVLKDIKKHTGSLATYDYLFKFLDAYDFASEGTEDIQEDSKTIINASALGKVFEKINGYKDGSIFTPGFITMYMCRQSIRLAVVEKFSEYGLTNNLTSVKPSTFEEIYDLIPKQITKPKANEIINSLKICDPAVGSGHFLVSALNEIIAIKSELGILMDENGKTLRDYEIEIVNDELIVTDDNGDPFAYNYKSAESSRVQKTLFHEKQAIIENCLFGVDINPNSVKICRLRLWIELLKNAYYNFTDKETGQTFDVPELETLPNIDINIKCGNSLLSRFPLDADLSKALKSIKYDIKAYRGFVNDYKNEKNRDVKRGLQKIIDAIKGDFRTEISANDPKIIALNKKGGELYDLVSQTKLFDDDPKQIKIRKEKQQKLEAEINKLSKDVDEIKTNAIYKNAFEWRFEFPEVLNNNGDFEGFDVVIGNPPYGVKFNQLQKEIFLKTYSTVDDIYTIFIERGHQILKRNGSVSFINPIFWLTGENYVSTRRMILEKLCFYIGIVLPYNIFTDAYVDTGIFMFFKNNDLVPALTYEFGPKDKVDQNTLNEINFKKLNVEDWKNSKDLKIVFNPLSRLLLNKFNKFETKVFDITDSIRGILADKDDYSDNQKDNGYQPIFVGKLDRYYHDNSFAYVKYGDDLKEKPTSFEYFRGERLLIRRIISRQFRIMATLSSNDFVNKKDIYVFKLKPCTLSSKFLLAVINSKLISYIKTNASATAKKDDFTQLTLNDIRELRIPIPNQEQQQKIEYLVSEIMSNKKSKPNADTTSFEKGIDQLVYQLYDITLEEQKIIEGNNNRL